MEHENVVKLYEYTETKDEFVLYMEYCDLAGYLPDKILEVSSMESFNSNYRGTLPSITMINLYPILKKSLRA